MSHCTIRLAVLLILACLSRCAACIAQDLIIRKDSSRLECRDTEIGSKLIRYRAGVDSTMLSVETGELRSVRVGDTTFVVYPARLGKDARMTRMEDFKEALRTKDYAKLLHSRVIVQEAVFEKGKVTIAPASRTRLIALVKLLKADESVRYGFFVHTDTSGKAAANQTISNRRAANLRQFLITQGMKSSNILAEGRGEVEPIHFSKATQDYNRRVEMRVISVAGVKVLYAEKIEPVAAPVTTPPPVVQEAVSKKPASSKSDSRTRSRNRPHSIVTVGFDAFQMLSIGGREWADERKGVGLKRTLGISANYSVRFNGASGIVAHIGFDKWKSEYRVNTDTEQLYRYSVHLSRISAGVGPKFYLGKSVYASPQGELSALLLRRNQDWNGTPDVPDRLQRVIYWGASAAIGYEFPIADRFLVDASISYHYSAKPFRWLDYAYPPNKSLHLIGGRLAFGLVTHGATDK
ncbi:OmpA family protein [Dyadobacter sp. CY261]|uniref:OmpA family protein n=1 Tax=Dyadobacter sp. CY261 TaxID=2907203 RepID=UPI001F193744|nr:OmpA family protein [Dyadobacter sp. CY261]MCF0074991.1 OmpA family protein [Dyadobacter sp. CY261]